MTYKPRPLGNAARAHVTDAERAAREIRRIVSVARNLSSVDRRGLEARLSDIEVQALLIELELTKAQTNGNGGE